MDKKLSKLLAAAFAVMLAVGIFALAGCSSSNTNSDKASASDTQTVTDMVGRTVEVPAEADKVIGIGASSLRMICYMQAADKVVGVEQSEQQDSVTCAYRHVNHETFAKLPVVYGARFKGVGDRARQKARFRDLRRARDAARVFYEFGYLLASAHNPPF